MIEGAETRHSPNKIATYNRLFPPVPVFRLKELDLPKLDMTRRLP